MTEQAVSAPDAAEEPVVDARDVAAEQRGLVCALADAMLHAGTVVKDTRHAEQGFTYASAEVILAAVRAPLLERAIVLKPQPTSYVESEITSKGGARGLRVVVEFDFEFHYGPTGEVFVVRAWRGEGQDYADKAYTKAYTNVVKTFVKAQWLLPAEQDETGSLPERVANLRIPAWAHPISSDEDKRRAIDLATQVLGDRDAAKTLLSQGAPAYGGIPRVVLDLLNGLAVTLKRGGAQPPEAAAAADPQPDAAAVADPASDDDEDLPFDGSAEDPGPEDDGPLAPLFGAQAAGASAGTAGSAVDPDIPL